MSGCPSLTLSCDNLSCDNISCHIWYCCGSAKDPDDGLRQDYSRQPPPAQPYLPTQPHVVTEPAPAPLPVQQHPQPAPPHYPPTQPYVVLRPPPTIQAPYYEPPSQLVPPQHVSPALAPQAASTAKTPRAPVPPCNRAREPPAPAATPIPAAVPSKRCEPPQPAPRPLVPPNEMREQRVMPLPARLPSRNYEPSTPQAPPPVNVTSQPPARTTWPPRVKSKTYEYDDAGEPPAVSLPPPSTPIAPRARGLRYPPAPHPRLGDTEPRIESYSQAASLHQEYY
ncbi:hypothetical protein D1007_56015 [Hordeum vulgare]|uniref:Uncharacterized protein n=1 Tax=Hordeum vulgare subsp. vulgare TaxID=112509 RepID=A0A8I6XEB1_HORVV|nr:extensin-like [Hordeum vulgare subsp. vulgare]KAE8772040.1 hypothetical protein D1007_56015 [Hordeum vulgare]